MLDVADKNVYAPLLRSVIFFRILSRMNEPWDSPYFTPEAETNKPRRNLPHWQQGAKWCVSTWRLADSVPREIATQWHLEKTHWLETHPVPWDEATEAEYHRLFSTRMENWLNKGTGSCVLRIPENARIVAGALEHFNGRRCELAAYVVMPNHAHVLFRPIGGYDVPGIMKSWKGFTAFQINKRMGRKGKLWQAESWDRLIRNERHFYKTAEYIRLNPLMAGLREGFILWERNNESQ